MGLLAFSNGLIIRPALCWRQRCKRQYITNALRRKQRIGSVSNSMEIALVLAGGRGDESLRDEFPPKRIHYQSMDGYCSLGSRTCACTRLCTVGASSLGLVPKLTAVDREVAFRVAIARSRSSDRCHIPLFQKNLEWTHQLRLPMFCQLQGASNAHLTRIDTSGQSQSCAAPSAPRGCPPRTRIAATSRQWSWPAPAR